MKPIILGIKEDGLKKAIKELRDKYVKRKERLYCDLSLDPAIIEENEMYEIQEYEDVCQFIKELEEILKDD